MGQQTSLRYALNLIAPSSLLAARFPLLHPFEIDSFLFQPSLVPILSVAMSPSRSRRGQKKVRSPVPPPPVFEPGIERSIVLNDKGMDKVHPALAAASNEWGVMQPVLLLAQPLTEQPSRSPFIFTPSGLA